MALTVLIYCFKCPSIGLVFYEVVLQLLYGTFLQLLWFIILSHIVFIVAFIVAVGVMVVVLAVVLFMQCINCFSCYVDLKSLIQKLIKSSKIKISTICQIYHKIDSWQYIWRIVEIQVFDDRCYLAVSLYSCCRFFPYSSKTEGLIIFKRKYFNKWVCVFVIFCDTIAFWFS